MRMGGRRKANHNYNGIYEDDYSPRIRRLTKKITIRSERDKRAHIQDQLNDLEDNIKDEGHWCW
jgi:hypothetical protein